MLSKENKIKTKLILFVTGLFLISIITAIFLFPSSNQKDFIGLDLSLPVAFLKTEDANAIQQCFTPTLEFNPLEGKKAIGFFSLRCRHCREGARLLSNFAATNDIHDNFMIFFTGKEVNVDWFFKTAEVSKFSYRMMNKETMIKITEGEVPLLFLMENGVVKQILNFDNNTENELSNFFLYEKIY